MKARLSVLINGAPQQLPAGISVAAALALAGDARTRVSVSGPARAPLCGIGQCHECRVTIDGRPQQLACMTPLREGMRIEAAQA
jgi:aerobic-type carbon monoxide dehydrogenase small subunit (CoxS/CutS family)